MNEKYVRYNGFNDITPPSLDGTTHRFNFTIGEVNDGNINNFNPIDNFSLDISVSGTLQSVWGLNKIDVPACSGTLSMNHIIASGGRPNENIIVYTTENAPEQPPEKMNVTSGNQFIKIPESEPTRNHNTGLHISLAAKKITELRDNINTLFKDLSGKKLLNLESERVLIDVYFPADTIETFASRLSALANLVMLFNVDILKKN